MSAHFQPSKTAFLQQSFALRDTNKSEKSLCAAEARIAKPLPARGIAENPTARTVLVADDDPTLRCLVCETLRGAGLRVLEAADGREAIEVAGGWNGPIDLLVTDVEMPYLDGPGLAEKLLHRRPGLPVLFVSALPDGPAASMPRPFTFLAKPFRIAALLEQVRRLLGPGPWEKGVA